MHHEDLVFLKARQRLASELDIMRILQTLRLFRVTLKYLVTPRQRKLLRLQADRDVVEVNEKEHENLKKPLLVKNYRRLLKE